MAEHWPVFAVLAAVFAVMVAVAAGRRGRTLSDDGVTTATVAGWALVLVVPPLVYVFALSGGFSVPSALFASFLAATVLLWVFGVVAEFVPALVAVVAALLVGLAPSEVALGGFSSPSMLLLLGVFALSAVISSSGLSYRVMMWLLLRLPDTAFWHQTILLLSGYGLSPLVPSTNARMSLLTPVYTEMAAGLRLPARGPGITALLASMFGGAILFSPMMATSKSSNIAALAMLPPQVQEEFSGFFWLFAAAVAAGGVTVIHLLLVHRLFPAHDRTPMPRDTIRAHLDERGPLQPAEWVAAGGFVFFLLGTATVSWHHVKPAYLAGCVLLALLLTGTLLRKDFQRAIDWPMIVFLLGMDSLLRVMNHLGLARQLALAAGRVYDFVGGRVGLFILAALITTMLLRLVLPVTAGMLTAVVILLPVAAAQGVHPWICAFCCAVFSDISIFRHQGTNGIIQMRVAGMLDAVDEPGFLRYNMGMNAARVAVVYASIPWWHWLGLL